MLTAFLIWMGVGVGIALIALVVLFAWLMHHLDKDYRRDEP